MKYLLFCLINMERNEISKENKWSLEDLYLSESDYNKDINKVKELTNELLNYKGIILDSSNNLLNVLLLNEQIDMITEKLYVYINMKLHEDTRISKYQEASGNLDIIMTELNEKTSFFVPELLEKDYSLVLKYIEENKELLRFKFLLETIYNEKEHTLSKELEELLSRSGNIISASDNIFSTLSDADLVFGKITDENGNKVNITHGNFSKYMTSKNRNIRKNTFNTLYKKYKELNNTFSSIMNANLQSSNFLVKTRKYKNPINLYLDSNRIDENIYYNLIKLVNNNMKSMYKYIDLRSKELNINKLHMYDMSVKIIDDNNKSYSFDEAKNIVTNALSVLGDKYIKDLNNAFKSSWIDIYENKGKRSGAYSWGCYNAHPYVLLNYQSKYNDVSTLAHEMGHAMHKYYTNDNQDYYYSDNAIFVAEIASTVNEILLNLYMLNKSKDNKEKKLIINELLDDFKNTVYRQTMFAEFELDIHNKSFNGETLSSEKLNEIYLNLVKKYHGKNVIYDDYIKYEWARIPHFYSPFYVYQYATGFSIAFDIANRIFSNDKEMLEKYLKFLSSGSNDYPTRLVEKMGINIQDSINNALKMFDKLIDEYMNIDKE